MPPTLPKVISPLMVAPAFATIVPAFIRALFKIAPEPADARSGFENQVLPVLVRGHGADPTHAPLGTAVIDSDH